MKDFYDKMSRTDIFMMIWLSAAILIGFIRPMMVDMTISSFFLAFL